MTAMQKILLMWFFFVNNFSHKYGILSLQYVHQNSNIFSFSWQFVKKKLGKADTQLKTTYVLGGAKHCT